MRFWYVFLVSCNLFAREDAKPLESKSFDEIIKKYSFIGDFSQKEATRALPDSSFWKYPFIIESEDFALDYDFGFGPDELPATEGNVRAIQHMNRGRIFFVNKDFEEARKTWLSARSRYGKENPANRRNDYFIGLAFLHISKKILEQFENNKSRSEVRLSFSNTATFLAWAFIKKKDDPDPMLDKVAPKAYFNLAAIYFMFGRFAGAHSAAETGLEFLRKTGREDYRPRLRRILAETWIRDRQYLKAMQELDTLIRQDPIPMEVAKALARVGDIYFDLNNYELAQEIYGLSARIFDLMEAVDPLLLILRGESLFWLGQFEKAQELFDMGLYANGMKISTKSLSLFLRSWAKLRRADTFLARASQLQGDAQKNMFEKAYLAYYQVQREYPNEEASQIALVRQRCLDYKDAIGNNRRHGQEDLEKLRQQNLPRKGIELAWSCELLSYAKIPNVTLVDKIKSFKERFPDSAYLNEFIPSLKVIRARHLDEYLDKGDLDSAQVYYEMEKDILFKKLLPEQEIGLFRSYVKNFKSEKARDFWPTFLKQIKTDQDILDSLVFLAENPDLVTSELNKVAEMKIDIANLAFNEENKERWYRVINSEKSTYFLPLIFPIGSAWGKEQQSFCEFQVPLISLISEQIKEAKMHAIAGKSLSLAIEQYYPKIFNTNFDCAQHILDLELKLAKLEKNELEYALRWKNRLNWPFKKVIVPLIWVAAEQLYNLGEKDEARQLWTFLSKIKDQQFPEIVFAKGRLEQNNFEVQNLWKAK